MCVLLRARYLWVLDATADFTTGKAKVWVNTNWGGSDAGFNLDKVRASLAEMGYELEDEAAVDEGEEKVGVAAAAAAAATATDAWEVKEL